MLLRLPRKRFPMHAFLSWSSNSDTQCLGKPMAGHPRDHDEDSGALEEGAVLISAQGGCWRAAGCAHCPPGLDFLHVLLLDRPTDCSNSECAIALRQARVRSVELKEPPPSDSCHWEASLGSLNVVDFSPRFISFWLISINHRIILQL